MSKAPLFLPALPLASVRIALALAVLGGPLAAGSAGAGAGSPARWRPAPEPAGAAVAVAWDPATGRLAVADRGAVWVGPVSGPLEPVHREQGVTELVFGDDGALWIAGASGLHRWRAGGPSRALAPGPGVGGVTRVRAVDGWWLVAGADGLHRRGPADGWARLDPGLPAEPVSALAVAAEPGEPGGLRLGAVVAGVAHWLRLAAAGGGAVRERARVGTPGDGPRAAVDVWITRDAGEAWTLLRDGCLVGPERVCAPLPPGAEAERVFHAGGRWWLATARGLLVAPEARGPWRRAPPPLGGLAIHAVAGDATTWLVGSERGLWVGGPEAQAGSPAVAADGAALRPALGAV